MVESWLNEIEAPTLVVAGGDDPLIPAVNGVILASRIPTARMRLFPDDGHLVLFDADSPAIPFIEEFLTAASLDDSSSWAAAAEKTDEDESSAIPTTHTGMFPWGMASAVYRTAFASAYAAAPVRDRRHTSNRRLRGEEQFREELDDPGALVDRHGNQHVAVTSCLNMLPTGVAAPCKAATPVRAVSQCAGSKCAISRIPPVRSSAHTARTRDPLGSCERMPAGSEKSRPTT